MAMTNITKARSQALAAAKDNGVTLDSDDLKEDTAYHMVESGRIHFNCEYLDRDYARAQKIIDSKPTSFWKQ